MDVGTTVATVTLAKAVVVHAVVFGLLLLACLSDDGEASLDRTACFGNKAGRVTTSQSDCGGPEWGAHLARCRVEEHRFHVIMAEVWVLLKDFPKKKQMDKSC